MALVLEGSRVAAQVLMTKEWEGLKVPEGKREKVVVSKAVALDDCDVVFDVVPDFTSMDPAVDRKQRTIKSLLLYMLKLSLVQGLLGLLSILLLH